MRGRGRKRETKKEEEEEEENEKVEEESEVLNLVATSVRVQTSNSFFQTLLYSCSRPALIKQQLSWRRR